MNFAALPALRRCSGMAFLGLALTLSAQESPAPDKPTLAVLVLQGAFQTPQSREPQAPNGPLPWSQNPRNPRRPPVPARARPLGELLVQRIDLAYHRTGRFQLIERSQMQAVLKEGIFEQKGAVDDATAVTLGRQLGARFVLVGSYNGSMAHAAEVQEHVFSKDTRTDFFPAKLEVRLRLVRTEDGSILEPITLNAAASDPQASKSFDLLMDDFARHLEHELALRYPLKGYVVKLLSEKEILSDLGRGQGVEEGDTFLLMETGPDAIHPVTGKTVPGERKVAGELVVTDAGPESSTLRVSLGKPILRPVAVLQRKPR